MDMTLHHQPNGCEFRAIASDDVRNHSTAPHSSDKERRYYVPPATRNRELAGFVNREAEGRVTADISARPPKDGAGGFRKATRTWNQVIPLNRT
jgi:hypothetical protein